MPKFSLKNIGPGTLVAAAFIGPGTIALCIDAGANYGFSLIWALILSTLATIFLQEIASRIGIVSQKGIANIVREELKEPWIKNLALFLIISAIIIGNTAYEAGNIAGGSLGISAFLNLPELSILGINIKLLNLVLGVLAFGILSIGNYKVLEIVLVLIVVLMSLSFLITALLAPIDWIQLLKSAFKPKIPQGGFLTLVGLIGTTIVPYNLFLHSSLVKEKWKSEKQLNQAKMDTIISIGFGGLVSISILIAATTIQSSSIGTIQDLSQALTPVFGTASTWITGIGIFAAGLTSAITAPLAAAFVASGCFNWEGGLGSRKFKTVWMTVLLVGTIISAFGKSPIQIIHFAQITNALLLPIIILFLVWIVNKKKLMGQHVNSLLQNVITFAIVLLTLFMAFRIFDKIFDILP